MMDSDTRQIRLLKIKDRVETISVPDTYEYHSWDKYRWPYRWLNHVCFWVLRKIHALTDYNMMRPLHDVQQIDINYDDIMDVIFENKEDVRRIYGKRAKYLICGVEAWKRITHLEESPYYFHLTIPPNYHARVGIDNLRQPFIFAGLQVIFVPWIEGVFVLPDLEN